MAFIDPPQREVIEKILRHCGLWQGNTLVRRKENDYPSPKRRVEEITKGEHRYTVTQGGTMDGRNCRPP